MEENREPLSAIAIEKKLQLLRNKHFSAEYLGEPGGEKAHHILHTSYVARERRF